MTTIDKFLTEVGKFPRTSAFRGQADGNWQLHSSATRRLIKHVDDDIFMNSTSFAPIYTTYHYDELIEPARTAGFGIEEGYPISDLQLLAKLQHFGAATGLIDFTWNPLVALWFACRACEGDERDGKVFVVDLNDPAKFQSASHDAKVQNIQDIFPREGVVDKPLYWEPMARDVSAPRILRQRSVFVIGRPTLPESVVDEIGIKAADKEVITRELEEQLDINERSLFLDIHGFSTANRVESPIRRVGDPNIYRFRGNRLCQQRNYTQAIESYDRCIQLAPDVRETYILRGNAKVEMRDFSGAQQDYNLALDRNAKPFHDVSPDAVGVNDIERWRILFNRGNVKAAQHDYEGAIVDYDEAMKCSPHGPFLKPLFFNRANVKATLYRFEDAIGDYDEAISLGSSGAHFNKGNALILLGRFDEARRCYESLREEPHSPGTIRNNDAVKGVLKRINGARYETSIESKDTPVGQTQVNVLVKGSGNVQETQSFPFQGNIGNTGNFGGTLPLGGRGLGENFVPGGTGFDGRSGFAVTVIGSKN